MDTLGAAISGSEEITGSVLRKAAFWQRNSMQISDKIQREIINRLFDGFTGNLTSGKVAKMLKISQPTAVRTLRDLVDKEFLDVSGAGCSTHYVLAVDYAK